MVYAKAVLIQALKKVSRNITPQAVQKALATQTWQIQGLVGPTVYPASTAVPTGLCQDFRRAAPEGSGYTIIQPFACCPKKYPILPKFTG